MKELETNGRLDDLESGANLFAKVEQEYHRVRPAIELLFKKEAA